MWRTQIGKRVLRGSEWDLFREGLSTLWDQVEMSHVDPELCMTDVGVFDRLQPAAKLAMLALVGQALHDEAEPCPDLTALTEGTFAAVYAVIRQEIEIEIDLAREDPPPGDPSVVRALVLAAIRELSSEWDESPEPGYEDEDEEEAQQSLPEPNCEDMQRWDDLLDELMDRVLWGDRDFDEEELFLDIDPKRGRQLKRLLSIAEDYFTDVAPEPTDAELASIRSRLRELCGRPEPGTGNADPRPDPGQDEENPWF
jgi:hypothetical protein